MLNEFLEAVKNSTLWIEHPKNSGQEYVSTKLAPYQKFDVSEGGMDDDEGEGGGLEGLELFETFQQMGVSHVSEEKKVRER